MTGAIYRFLVFLTGPFRFLQLAIDAAASLRYAEARAMTGLEFDRFGGKAGLSLLRCGRRAGLKYLLNPLESFRYWEFPFVWPCLPERPGSCLDVSSPPLFSFCAAKNLGIPVPMINPDEKDLAASKTIAASLKIPGLTLRRCGAEMLMTGSTEEAYDVIWSISVLEHISGEYDDRDAVKAMYGALVKAGRLILTVPVDRAPRNEFAAGDVYGTQAPQENGMYFFQRLYDKKDIRERLIKSIGVEPSEVRWFGEKRAGHYDAYARYRAQAGLRRAVRDPKEMADHYKEFNDWDEMPGMGVCGLVFEKR